MRQMLAHNAPSRAAKNVANKKDTQNLFISCYLDKRLDAIPFRSVSRGNDGLRLDPVTSA